MPVDALPQPRPAGPEPLPDAVRFTRRYADSLGRPLVGTVTLTPASRSQAGDVAVLAAPVPVQLVNGVLDVELPPGTYRLSAADLRTVDGAPVPAESGTLTVSAARA